MVSLNIQAYYTHANKAHLYQLNGRWFCCDECQKFFPNKPVLDSHKSTVHSKADMDKRRAEKVTCEFCAQTLRNRAVSFFILLLLSKFPIYGAAVVAQRLSTYLDAE